MIIALGECWLNQGLADLVTTYLQAREKREAHCTGVTICIVKLDKKIRAAAREKPGTRLLLVVDREKARELQAYLEAFLNKHNCKTRYSEKPTSKNITIYTCHDDTVTLIVFNGPPEEILEKLDTTIREELKNPDNRKRFKNKKEVKIATEKLKSSKRKDCKHLENIVERGLCLLFNEIKKSL